MNRLCMLLFLLMATAMTEAGPPIEAYAALPEANLVTLSPSGERLAFRQSMDGNDVVAVYDLVAGKRLAAVDVAKVDPRDLLFVGEDTLLLVAGTTLRSFFVRSAFDYSAAFALDLESGNVRPLLRRARDLYPYQSGLGRVVGLSADGRDVFMPAFEQVSRDAAPRYSLYRVRLGSTSERVVRKGSAHTIDWFLDADGQPLVREDYDNQGRLHQIWVVDGSRRRLLYEEETDLRTLNPVGLTPDRDALIVTAYDNDGRRTFYSLALDDGEMAGPLLETRDKSVETILMDANRVVLGVEFRGFKPSYEFFDEELTARIRDLQAMSPDAAMRLTSYSADFSSLVMHVSGGWTSGASLLFRNGDNAPQLIAADRPSIERADVAPVSMTIYAARDGLKIPALVTAKTDVREAGRAALVVLPHGGPEAHDRYGFDWLAQYFASRDYVVLQPQFRGSTGFGWAHIAAGRGEWGAAMQTDLDDGVRHLVDTGLVDPERVCVVGASYGGYAAAAAGVFSDHDYRCLVAINGVFDLRRMLEKERRDHGRNHWVLRYWSSLYGTEGFDKDALDARSPAQHAERFSVPLLLVHGKDDTVVPVEQSRAMHKALQRADKPVRYLELDGEDHWLSYAETRLAALSEIAGFVEEHIEGRSVSPETE